MTFREFINAAIFKPKTTALKKQLFSGLKVFKDLSKPIKFMPSRLKANPNSNNMSLVPAVTKRQRLTNPKNRFKIRKSSN